MERITPLDLLGDMKRQHAQSNARRRDYSVTKDWVTPHRDLERSYTTRKRVASERNIVLVDENINISIAREKEEDHMEDVEMDKDHDVYHSKTKEAL
ncbi:hypothetical protein Tco_0087466 [Tanacetum coccineum]